MENGRKNVLIIEDDNDTNNMYKSWLNNFWTNFTIVGTLQWAREAIDNQLNLFDIISFDWRLPDGATWDLVRETRSKFGWIMISATSDPDIRKEHCKWWCDYVINNKNELPKKILSIINN